MRVQIVSFHCVLKNVLGEFISSSFNQDVVTTPSEAEASLLPSLVKALRRLKKGQKKKIKLSAEQAYGFYHPELVKEVSRKKLRHNTKLKVGDLVYGDYSESGTWNSYRIVAINSEKVTLDANHPLAGQDLVFDVQMVSSHEETEPTLPSSIFRGDLGFLC